MTPVEQLQAIGPGLHKCGWVKGYLEVEQTTAGYCLLWTNQKDHHQPLFGPAVSLEINAATGEISQVFKSVLRMHRVTDPEEIKTFTEFIIKKIDLVYKRAYK